MVWSPLPILALLSSSLGLLVFSLLWGQGQEPREQEEETRAVKFYGARVVCTTQMSSVTGDVQMLVLSPVRASPLSLQPVMELASCSSLMGSMPPPTSQSLTSIHVSYSDIVCWGHLVPPKE